MVFLKMQFIVVSVLLCLAIVPAQSAVQCPDAITECPDQNTCCLMSNNKYGCCPLPSATCCSDHEHCCPFGFNCDVFKQTCYNGEVRIKMSTKVPAKMKVCCCIYGLFLSSRGFLYVHVTFVTILYTYIIYLLTLSNIDLEGFGMMLNFI